MISLSSVKIEDNEYVVSDEKVDEGCRNYSR